MVNACFSLGGWSLNGLGSVIEVLQDNISDTPLKPLDSGAWLSFPGWQHFACVGIQIKHVHMILLGKDKWKLAPVSSGHCLVIFHLGWF
jgi:hypothetical protein